MLVQRQQEGHPQTTIENSIYKDEMTSQVSSKILLRKYLFISFFLLQSEHIRILDLSTSFIFTGMLQSPSFIVVISPLELWS